MSIGGASGLAGAHVAVPFSPKSVGRWLETIDLRNKFVLGGWIIAGEVIGFYPDVVAEAKGSMDAVHKATRTVQQSGFVPPEHLWRVNCHHARSQGVDVTARRLSVRVVEGPPYRK